MKHFWYNGSNFVEYLHFCIKRSWKYWIAGLLLKKKQPAENNFFGQSNSGFNSEVIEKMSQIFKVGKSEKQTFMYTGFRIHQSRDGILLGQEEYVDQITITSIDPSRRKDKNAHLDETERTCLRRMAGTLNWVVRGTRPDLSFEMIDISTKFCTGKVQDLVRVSKALSNVKQNDAFVFFPALEHKNLKE